MKKTCLLTLAASIPFMGLPFLLVSGFLADSAAAVVSFDWVTVGDPGNTADTTRVMNKGPVPDLTTGYGSVDHVYNISKTHVTNSQYVEFLNAVDPNGLEPHPILGNPNGIYSPNMTSSTIGTTGLAYTGGIDFTGNNLAGFKYSAKDGQENYPATWINWDSGARFVNWLSNGQGTGDTEDGVYDMSLGFSPGIGIPSRNDRQPGAKIFMPSEDEFYKAAYYDPTKGGTGGYWEYGVQSDTAPVSQAPAGGATSANYRGTDEATSIFWQTGMVGGVPFNDNFVPLVDVGSYSTAKSYYGLFDVDGQLYQWTEDGTQEAVVGSGVDFPVYRGGSWYYWAEDADPNGNFIGASYRNLYSFPGAASYAWFGLRIASTLSADFEPDGDVDSTDLATWEASYSVNAGGDTDGDLDSDGADFLAWQQQFTGALPLSALTSVPEPSSAVLLCTLVAASVLYRQRRYAI